jgi:hypothetical protein
MHTKNILWALGMSAVLAACNSTSSPTTPTADHHTQQMNFNQKTDWVQVRVQSEEAMDPDQLMGYIQNGKIMFQGDVVLAEAPSQVNALSAIETNTRRWTNNTVPYVIDSTLSGQTTAIQTAIAYYNQNTNVRWVPRTTETNHVRFVKSSGCWSYVGMIGGKQDLSLGDGCYSQHTILHEMTHAVGMHHEQTRPDRDQHVTINWNVIPTDWHSQFQIINSARAYGNYDFYSVMHYGLYWGNQLAMTPKVSGIDYSKVGRGSTLTAIDLAAVNSIYQPLTPCSGTGCTQYTDTLSATRTKIYHPSAHGFLYAGGALKGWLQGPKTTGIDFNLLLQKWNGTEWVNAVSSKSTTSTEAISYTAAPGTYRFRVNSNVGYGSYAFWMQQ